MTSTNWPIPYGFTSHQLCFLKIVFRLPIQSLRIIKFKLVPLVIARLHNMQNDVRSLDISTSDTVESVIKMLDTFEFNFEMLRLHSLFSKSTSISYEYETEIINSGILPLVQNLGGRLKSLDISCSDTAESILKTLNMFGFNVEMLRLNSLFSKSRSAYQELGEIGRYVRHLTISVNKFSNYNMNSFKYLTSLKSLRIGYMKDIPHHDNSLYLDEILDLFPNTLESLEIYDFVVNCRARFSSTYKVKRLAVYTENITQSVYQFVSSCLPSLHHLTIDLQKTTYHHILLKGVNLKYLNISIKEKQYLLVRTLNNNATCYYPLLDYTSSEFDCGRKGNEQLDLVRRSTRLTHSFIFQFFCNSINELIINNHLAL